MPASGPNDRPLRPMLLVALIANGAAAAALLALMFGLFGVRDIPPIFGTDVIVRGELLSVMTPLLAICMACLWYWLIARADARGISFGAAMIFGVELGLAAVPAAAALAGAARGDAVLSGLVGLLCLILVPSLSLAAGIAGAALGLANGLAAQAWLDCRSNR